MRSLIICTPQPIFSGDQIEKNEVGACSMYGERIDIYRVLMGKPDGKRPLGRPTRKWEDNNKMDFQEVRCESMEWIDVAQNKDRCRALVNAVMSIWVP